MSFRHRRCETRRQQRLRWKFAPDYLDREEWCANTFHPRPAAISDRYRCPAVLPIHATIFRRLLIGITQHLLRPRKRDRDLAAMVPNARRARIPKDAACRR